MDFRHFLFAPAEIVEHAVSGSAELGRIVIETLVGYGSDDGAIRPSAAGACVDCRMDASDALASGVLHDAWRTVDATM